MPKLSRDTLMKVGIAVAVALILYLILRSVTCSKREQYAMFAPARGHMRRRREGYATFAAPRRGLRRREGFEAAATQAAQEYYPEAEAEEATGAMLGVTSAPPTHLAMESTLDDAQANAEFAPDA